MHLIADNHSDSILFYSKSETAYFNYDYIRIPYSAAELAEKYKYKDEKGKYYDGPVERSLTMGPRPTMVYEYKGYTTKLINKTAIHIQADYYHFHKKETS